MKKILSLLLSCVLLFNGLVPAKAPAAQEILPTDEETAPAPGEDDDDFIDPENGEWIRSVEDSVYAALAGELEAEDYSIEDIQAVYISQEFIDELAFNSRANIYFGYTLEDLDREFQGTRYVFYPGDEGTMVKAFEAYDATYEDLIKKIAIGTGVVLIHVTISLVTAHSPVTSISMIVAFAGKKVAKTLLVGALRGVTVGVMTGLKGQSPEQSLKDGLLAGGEEYVEEAICALVVPDMENVKWGGIAGAIKDPGRGLR